MAPVLASPGVIRTSTYATFNVPDSNGWLLQEIKTRLSDREWRDRRAAYRVARERGRTPDQASQAAARYMEEVLDVAAL
jgi:hypothetical protein